MSNNQSLQCDFCFYAFSPFYEVRILPITPIATLSGAATPPHATIPGARKIVCHHCRYSHYNIEPWTEPEEPSSSLLVPPEAADQPLTEVSMTSPAPAIEYDGNQSALNQQNNVVMLPSISLFSPSSSLNENTYTERQPLFSVTFVSLSVCQFVSSISFLYTSLLTSFHCCSKQSAPITNLSNILALCRLIDSSVGRARSPPGSTYVTCTRIY
jgi:hypothetical protein